MCRQNQRISRWNSACSRAVFWLWWRSHKLWRLSVLVNRSQSPRNGFMWSTTVAGVLIPCVAHSRQNGSRISCCGRSLLFQIGLLYQEWYAADAPRCREGGLCFEHQPSRVSSEHPACLHGLKGICAIGLSPPTETQSACADKHLGAHRRRRSGSGSSFDIMLPARHRLQ